ncbi:hypothetical protein ASPCAL14624 [Aspergillus calidoustus]|uniref:F-box domain-containing protein n=1 Tax=Aspergillus calidoustus TaxID=454130 RepID=A0A0U5GGE3_ASPCI|nr:hypothetical protein ASPCAL14624 [Aspergillus calidoustus]
MDTFDKLPAEIILTILAHCDDFSGPVSLLSVSPRVHAVFQTRPRVIALSLIASNPITQRPVVNQLCQQIALLHQPSVHCSSFEDYRRTCEAITALPETLDVAELLQIIRIAAHVERLTCICLRTMHQAFISAVEKHPAGESSGSTRAEKARDPFSWVEHYRVSSALWHLRHFSTLKMAAERRWNWPAESLNALNAYLEWNYINPVHAEQIWTISAVLADLGLVPSHQIPRAALPIGHSAPPWLGRDLLDEHTREPPLAIWHYPTDETRLPFFASFHLPQATSAHSHSSLFPPPPVPAETPASTHWGLTAESSESRSARTGLMRVFSLRMARAQKNYGTGAIRPFRRLGVTIWDKWRIYQVGLLRVFSRGRVPTPDGGFIEAVPQDGPPRVDWVEMHGRWAALIQGFTMDP